MFFIHNGDYVVWTNEFENMGDVVFIEKGDISLVITHSDDDRSLLLHPKHGLVYAFTDDWAGQILNVKG